MKGRKYGNMKRVTIGDRKKKGRQPGCIKVKGPAIKKWASEPPLKFECKTRVASPEEIETLSFSPYKGPKLGGGYKAPIDLSIPDEEQQNKPLLNPVSHKNNLELEFSRKLAKRIGGKTEYANPAGRIDVLTDRFVIEVKFAENWKHAIGQVLVYSFYFPEHAPLICLIGDTEDYVETAEMHCDRHGILLRVESDFF